MYHSHRWWSASVQSSKKLNFYYRVRDFFQSSYNSTNAKFDGSSEKSYNQAETLYQKHAVLKQKQTSPSYIFNEDVADKIALKIMETRKIKDTPIIEYNPGPCLLTKKLFEKGAKSVIGIETKTDFQPYLKDTKSLLGGKKFNYHFWDPYMNVLYDSKKMSYLLTKEKDSFKEIKHKAWSEGPYASIFGILTPSRGRYFISLLINCLATKESIYSFGCPELFLLVHARNYKTMSVKFPQTNYLSYRKTSSILTLFFDIEMLMELKVSDVFPHFSIPRKFQSKSNSFGTVNKDSIYFVKILPKETRDGIFNPETYSKFLVFLNQILQKRSNRLIPKMESWLPGSGIHLIRMGYTMMHLIGEVTPEQYLQLFIELQNWPEYLESSLQAILINAAPQSEKDAANELSEESAST